MSMDELQIGAGSPDLFAKPAIVGAIEAGEAAKVTKKLKALINSVNQSTFDIMDLLYQVRTKKLYQPKFNTMGEFVETLELSARKSFYLMRIKEAMTTAGVSRSEYEPIGIAKLRAISSIQLLDSENNVLADKVTKLKQLLLDAPTETVDELKAAVSIIEGNVGDEAFVWFNVRIKKSAKAVVDQALGLVKAQMGSVGKDGDGNSKDASDGSALEKMALDYISDPNNASDVEALFPMEEANGGEVQLQTDATA